MASHLAPVASCAATCPSWRSATTASWYAGRATHIHFKVLLDDRNVLTGQMYFPDAVNEFIYANVSAYSNRLNPRSVVNANDRFANFHDPNRLSFCAVKEERDCYAASLVLAVDRFAVAQAERPAREGAGAEQPAIDRVRLLIPGFNLK
jgi:protocatechuate 3,4-dioxygenase beta subunit